jgi:tetratricopeptide (TPR) repeat protein
MKLINKIEKILKKKSPTKKDLEFLAQFKNSTKAFSRLKKEFLKYRKGTEKFKIFLFSLAIEIIDMEVVRPIIDDIKRSRLVKAKVLLGNLYSKLGDNVTAVEYYNEAFNRDYKKFKIEDIRRYLEALYDIGFFNRYRDVLSFLLKNEPEDRNYKLDYLIYQVRILHKKPNILDSIKKNLSYLESTITYYKEYNIFAYCYYEIGEPKRAFELYDKYYQNIRLKDTKREEKIDLAVSNVTESLNEILDILYKDSINAFIIGGTLLGFIREGKLLDHDKDADIGIFVEDYETVYKIVDKICEGRDFLAPIMVKEPKESLVWNVAIFDIKRKVGIDLFFYKKRGNRVYNGAWSKNGILKWEHTPFELIKREFNGFNYLIPKDYNLFLKELFGDWRKPVKVWDSLINCPNITPDSKIFSIYFALQRIHKAIEKRSIEGIENYINSLREKWNFELSNKALKNLEKIKDDIREEKLLK